MSLLQLVVLNRNFRHLRQQTTVILCHNDDLVFHYRALLFIEEKYERFAALVDSSLELRNRIMVFN